MVIVSIDQSDFSRLLSLLEDSTFLELADHVGNELSGRI